MKKLLMIVLALLAANIVSVSAQSTVDEITIADKNVEIKGTTDDSMSQLGVVIIPKSDEKNIVAIAESFSDKNGEFNVAFKADFKNSLWSDGDYVAYIRINDEETIEKEFYYYSQDGKQNVIDDFIKKSNERLDMLKENSSAYKTFCAIKIKVDELTQAQMENFVTKVAGALKDDMSEDEFSIVMNKGVLAVLCEGDKRDEALSLMKDVLDGFSDFDETRQNWVSDTLIKNTPYSDVDVLDTMYKRANALYDINYAQHSELRTLITNNAKVLGIENENTYMRFSKLTILESGKVCEKLFNLMTNKDVNTSKELVKRLETAMSSVSVNTGNNGGGGSAGGSSGKNNTSGVVTTVGTYPTAKPEESDKNNDGSFDDIQSVSWAKEAIEALSKKNIISGVGNGKFEPERAVTREEFLAMLVRAGKLTSKQGEIKFDDVKNDAWYYEIVKTAYTNEIISGVNDNWFGVGQKITREDMAVMTDRVFGKKLSLENKEKTFSDFDDVSDYAKESILRLCENGIINGMNDGTFAPKGETTRAQAAVVLYRVLNESGVDL